MGLDIRFGYIGTSAGVGFAIPSSTVLKIVPQLIQFGKVSSFMVSYGSHYLILAASSAGFLF